MYRMLLLITTLILSAHAAYADVSFGILMPLTGAGSRYGQEQRVAVDMFLEKYSDLGGASGRLVPIIYDTRWSGAEAISVARKLIDSDKVAVIADHHANSRQAGNRHGQSPLGIWLRHDRRQARRLARQGLAREIPFR